MSSTSSPPSVPSLKEQLVRESCAMVRQLVTNGIRVPPSVIQSADEFEVALEQKRKIDMTALASTHERLSRLVAPAKPGTLYLLDSTLHLQGSEASTLGPIKLVRDLVRVAMACVVVFIILSVMAMADAHPTVQLFNRDMVIVEIILERVFWLSAAGIGASFAMLFQLNDQIVARTYDPDETASYWVKFFLGLVAGFILVALVPVDDTANTSAEALGPPTIALLGGFSASAVYRILTRMVEALESIFTGGPKEQAAAAEKAASARAAEESGQARMAVAGQLVEIQQRLAAGLPSEQAAAHIKQVVATLVPASSEFSTSLQPVGGNPGTSASPPDDGGAAAADPSTRVPALAVVAAPADGSQPADGSASAAPDPQTASAPPSASAPAG